MTDIQIEDFTAADHTALISAVLDHPFHIIRHLDMHPGDRPTPHDILAAALQVRSFDTATKARLRAARDAYAKHGDTRNSALFATRTAKISTLLDDTETIEEMIAVFDQLLTTDDPDHGYMVGLEAARAVLIDGKDSIYSPAHPFYELVDPMQAGADDAVVFAAHTSGAHHVAKVDIATFPGQDTASSALAGAASTIQAISMVIEVFL
ncbi:MAG: hypothetical protein ABS81_08105 [Pseudonocardia sp. SCN 72-86]|nr:MAG: hypothetical protein ABS81_08105 [Pseudonocardia sp. SCN 72-86]